MKMLTNLKLASVLAPLALTFACTSANPDDGNGGSGGDASGAGGAASGGETASGGAGATDPGTGGGTPGTGGGTPGTGGGDVGGNPFAADWALLDTQATDPTNIDQCVGFVNGTDGPYRVWTPDDPNANPKDGNPCTGNGNTAAANGTCNVPAGFERKDSFIGNKACTCEGDAGFDCSTNLLPGITLGVPTVCGGIVDVIDETPCGTEFDTCMTDDVPTMCEYTTPKGCVCLEDSEGVNVWQCGSTNSWFDCGNGAECPSTWPDNLTSGADIKTMCNDPSCGGTPSCDG